MTSEQQAKIAELAELSSFDYALRRKDAAKSLGIGVADLDAAVKKARPSASVVEELKPWSKPVNGSLLADSIHDTLTRHVTFAQSADPVAATLWVFGTYLMDVWRVWPKVLISSPAKRCGKSTLCEVFEAHVHRSLIAANCTTAALFRTIEAYGPTFILDEADTFLGENPELNGVLNAGHTRRTANVIRLVGDDHEPRKFSVWCPQIIAGIGEQADTLADRSIRIDLKRQLPTERKDRVPAELFELSTDTRRKLLRWARDSAAQIQRAKADPGECGNDRARDNWEPLMRIASVLGDRWPVRVRSSYIAKEQHDSDSAEDDAALMLLRDMHGWFEARPTEAHITSANLTNYLHGMSASDRPWVEWGRGAFPITARQVSLKLKAFGIRPQVVRTGNTTARAYLSAHIRDAYERYVEPPHHVPPPYTHPSSVTAKQMNKTNGLREATSVTEGGCVTDENTAKPLKTNDCYAVTDEIAPEGEGIYNTDDIGDWDGEI